jgi:pyridoxal phosphate enzyme (YggS family)
MRDAARARSLEGSITLPFAPTMPAMPAFRDALQQVLKSLENAAALAERPSPRLLAVSKTMPPEAVRTLAGLGQRAFGENYVQEAVPKIQALADLGLEWHLIGHLQSNKCREVARHFDWLQTLDRLRLVAPLDRERAGHPRPLQVLIQVNPDGEAGKSGCDPGEIESLAAAVAAAPNLRLRGLMAIPEPHPDEAVRRATFRRLRGWFEALRSAHSGVDTLSMGMSGDYALAIEEGATMVRIGTALFGARG